MHFVHFMHFPNIDFDDSIKLMKFAYSLLFETLIAIV